MPQSNQRGIETYCGGPLVSLSFMSLNRTSVGLKPSQRGGGEIPALRLNRTSVGLKRQHHHRHGGKEHAGLNRTSVGLKPDGKAQCPLQTFLPQSNQRGIETLYHSRPKAPNALPQSNQRGIETYVKAMDLLKEEVGLNRTSVGLKHFEGRIAFSVATEPQSNQRGIETSAPNRPRAATQRASIEPAWD